MIEQYESLPLTPYGGGLHPRSKGVKVKTFFYMKGGKMEFERWEIILFFLIAYSAGVYVGWWMKSTWNPKGKK